MRTLLRATVASAVVAATAAQTPPAWNVLAVPGGVQFANVQSLGKVIAYQESGQVRAFSGFARRWVTQPMGAGSVRISNDSVLAVSSPDYHAFSAYTGEWRTLTLSPTAQVINPVSQRNDAIWLVRDGGDLWAFSAFQGSWLRLQVGINATAVVERHTAVVADGTSLFGLSAFRDAWVPFTSASPPATTRVQGTVGLVHAGSTLYGFSAQRNAWAVHAVPGANPTFSFGDDVALAWDPGTFVAFSGLRGTFAALTAPLTSSPQTADGLVYLADGFGQGWAYSAVKGAWTALPAAVSPVVLLSDSAILLSSTDRVHAYSSITHTTATALGSVSFSGLRRAVGSTVLQDGSYKFFSAILGRWVDAPADASTAQPPELCEIAALFRTQSGLAAFSARTASFTRLTTSAGVSTHVDAASAILAAVDGSSLHVYDGRRERWLTETLIGTPQFFVWRTTLLVLDNGGLRARGFGTFQGRIESVDLPGQVLGFRANSESGRLDFPDAIYGFSSDPDVLTLWQYPDFRRVFVGGAPMDVRVQGAGGGTGIGFFFLATRLLPAPAPFAGLGELELDPTMFVLLSALPVPMTQGYGVLRFPVPDDPALRGLDVAFQALVVPGAGSPYLTQSTDVFVF